MKEDEEAPFPLVIYVNTLLHSIFSHAALYLNNHQI